MCFVPLNLDPYSSEKFVEEAKDITLAAMFRVRSRVVHRSAVLEDLTWVLDELAFPGAVAAIWQSWRGAWLEEREARA